MRELELVEVMDVRDAEVERGEEYEVQFAGRRVGLAEDGYREQQGAEQEFFSERSLTYIKWNELASDVGVGRRSMRARVEIGVQRRNSASRSSYLDIRTFSVLVSTPSISPPRYPSQKGVQRIGRLSKAVVWQCPQCRWGTIPRA